MGIDIINKLKKTEFLMGCSGTKMVAVD